MKSRINRKTKLNQVEINGRKLRRIRIRKSFSKRKQTLLFVN